MTAEPETLRSVPCIDVGGVLTRDVTAILDCWSAQIRDRFPEARRSHATTLRDHLPGILQAVAEQLTSPDGADAPHHRPALWHGATWWDDGWSISQVIYDCLLLRRVVLEHLAQSLDRPLTLSETMAVGLVLDEVISSSIASYEASREATLRRVEEGRLRELAEQDRRKDEFLAMLGHELRNPLAAMASALALTRVVGPHDPTSAEAQEILERQVQQMTRLVDDLLDVSRIARGKLELRRTRIDLAQLAAQVAERLQPVFDAQQQAFHVALPDAPLWVDADPARLQQALANTLMTASKSTPPGGAIELAVGRESDDGVLCVRDNGLGIAPELLPKIFELDTQSREAIGAGLGIGLALVRRLVELHGGHVHAHSEGPGHGAEFTIHLPLAEPSGDTSNQSVVSRAPIAASIYRRALVVDDDPDLGAMLAKLIARCGVEVRVAGDGPSALALAANFLPELILLDIGLPGTNGYEVAAQLRALPGMASARFVALTGYGQPADRQRSAEAGFISHLVKPVSFAALQELVAATREGAPAASSQSNR